MLYDFHAASRRHFEAAEMLDGNTAAADAAHLYGLSAECGIKSVLLGTGVAQAAGDGDFPRGPLRDHIGGLSQAMASISAGRVFPAYLAMIQPDIASFSSWDINDRYKNETMIALGDYPRWKQAAAKVNAMLALAASQGCAS
jgi:hypothetical protein